MPTVTTRELKQNPRAVVERALATGLPYRITSHGRDTGAAVQADAAGARLRSVDALLAAQAHAIGASVMTANLADFAPFAAHVLAAPPPARMRLYD
ncbi:MAG: type II toxin-antitoxin system prevent-host-death family antitoxin [Bifidobacteriaceae bacterium]|nr:type II toxin-antitoxin system prevent-host-death family antitoxin [Bifidobacteriaceae bacterium]